MVYDDDDLRGVPAFPTIDSSDNPYFVGLFYDVVENVFMDEDGEVVGCMSERVHPNDLFLFRENRTDAVVKHRSQKDVLVELYWPDDDGWDGDPDTVCNYCNERNHPLCDLITDYD